MRRGVVPSAMLVLALLGGAHDPASASGPSPEARAGSPAPLAVERRSAPPRPHFIRDAQRTLRDLGYDTGPVDGTLGPRTRAALTRYQRAENLPATGELDPETMARLDVQDRLFSERRAADGPAVTSRRAH